MNPCRIYIIAGESSGDAHGAALMREIAELIPGVQFFGAGGPQMQKLAAVPFLNWTHEAVVGLWDVLVKYGYFREKFYGMYDQVRRIEPAAVIFVDYPGFNLRLAAYLRRKGFGGKLIYYISPQVWAWNRGRIPRMARYLDLMMCIFPFEKPLYEASGLRTEFVGHPMIAELEAKRMLVKRDPKLIGLLPGSREREVRRIFPVMLEAASILMRRDPSLRFEVSAASEKLGELIEQIAVRHDFPRIPIGVSHSIELMQRAFVGMVASGTATMEASFFRFPFVLLYKVSWFTFLPGRLLVKVNYLGMPNILAAEPPIIPEFIQHQAVPEHIAESVWSLYSDEPTRTDMIKAMDEIILQLAEGEAGHRAAEVVLQELGVPVLRGGTAAP